MAREVISNSAGSGTNFHDGADMINRMTAELYGPDGVDGVSGQLLALHPYVTLGPAGAPVPATMYLTPFKVRRGAKPISALGAVVTTPQTGKKFALAIYATDPTRDRPTGNPIATTAFTLSAATAAYVEGVLSALAASTAGKYWVAFQSDADTAIFSNAPATWGGVAAMIGDASITPGASSALQNLTYPNVFGSWPDLTGATLGNNTSNRGAAVYKRLS